LTERVAAAAITAKVLPMGTSFAAPPPHNIPWELLATSSKGLFEDVPTDSSYKLGGGGTLE
jgi:hypothetical protein